MATLVVPAVVCAAQGDILFSDNFERGRLAYNYATDVSFNNQPGETPPFSHTPAPNADGYDAVVTAVQFEPTGPMNAAGSGTT